MLFIMPASKWKAGGDNLTAMEDKERRIEQDIAQGTVTSMDEYLASAQYFCPHCRQQGRPDPDEAVRQQFRRYKLPESSAMWQQLDDEYRRSRTVRAKKYVDAKHAME